MNGRETHLPPLHPVRAADAAHSPAATGFKDKNLRTCRKNYEVWQVECTRWNFSFGFSPLLTVVTMPDYAKHDVLSASLAMSGDSISYSPTLSPLQKEGRTAGWKMRSHSSQGHNALLKGQCRSARCSQATAKALWPLCRGVTQSYILKHLSRTRL